MAKSEQNTKPTPNDRRLDREKALVEHYANAEAINKNMARLRALRLAREAAAPAAVEQDVKPAEKKQPANVVRYLKHQKSLGRIP